MTPAIAKPVYLKCQQDHNVFITVNSFRREIIIYGNDDAVETSFCEIQEMIERHEAGLRMQQISLDGSKGSKGIMKNLMRRFSSLNGLKTQLSGCSRLKINVVRRCLEFEGSKEAWDQLQVHLIV